MFSDLSELRAKLTEYEPAVKKTVSVSLPLLAQNLENPSETESPTKTEFVKFGLSSVEPAGEPFDSSGEFKISFSGGEILLLFSVFAVEDVTVYGGAVKTPVAAALTSRREYSAYPNLKHTAQITITARITEIRAKIFINSPRICAFSSNYVMIIS